MGVVGHLWRLAVVVTVLARHNVLPPAFRWYARLLRQGKAQLSLRPGQRLAAALIKLGPMAIKVGQFLSTRTDLVGTDFAADLAALHDRLPPFSYDEVRSTIHRELGQPVEQLYSHFEPQPAAAASIAQVHLAITSDQRQVAVKVLRPGTEKAFARDIRTLRWLARTLEHLVPSSQRLRPQAVVETFKSMVEIELNLLLEAAAADELRSNFERDRWFHVPAVDWGRTKRRVLTLERIEGIKLDDLPRLIQSGHDPQQILSRASQSFFQQVFRDGFFHGDLHGGNAFVLPNGSLAAVDFGIMGRLDRPTRVYLADILLGFLSADYSRVAQVHFQANYIPAKHSVELFAQVARSIGAPLLDKPFNQISLARLLGQLFAASEQFDMQTQPHLLLLQKSLCMAEGMGRTLAPQVNMWELARPLIEKWMLEHRGVEGRTVDGIERLSRLCTRGENILLGLEQVISKNTQSEPEARSLNWPSWLIAVAIGAGAMWLLTG